MQVNHSVHRSCGVALILVLGSLVFLSVLIVAFLAQSGTELKSSRLSADGASARILAQSATNIVMAEIKEATLESGGTGPRRTWASQPGMIRTYDDTGSPYQFFRLFSWDSMTGDGAFDPRSASNTIPLSGPDAWNLKKGLYTDLNEPVAGSYPILDANGIRTLTRSPRNTTVPSYYGYDANSDGLPDIDGFEIDPGKISYDSNSALSPSNNPVPMPVKWLYVLADGKIIAPAGASGSTINFTPPDEPSIDNPIIGRIAFWTDDESCKININTASEGIYSDYPRALNKHSGGSPSSSTSQKENLLALNQPVQGEYQRYPGHPAMTCLSTVFKFPPTWSAPVSKPSGNVWGAAYSAAEWNHFHWALELAKIAPRISNEASDGSNGGSRAATVNTVNQGSSKVGAAKPVQADSDRLYTDPDELAFRPQVNSNLRQESDSVLTPSTLTIFNKDALRRAGFFLTATSRAPDVNLFGKPRVGIWPLHLNDASTYRTAFDRLIAFCSTLRNDLPPASRHRYYFQRQDPKNSFTDLPDQNSGSSSGLGRNRMILEFLRSLTGKNIPGFGGNFAAKYSTGNGLGIERDQILVEIFDYIRSTNLADAALLPANRYTVAAPSAGRAGIAQVVPIVDAKTGMRGLGRFPTLQGCAILFIANADGDDPVVRYSGGEVQAYNRTTSTWNRLDPQTRNTSQVNSAGMPYNLTNAVPAGHVRVQAMFVPQFFNPALGSVWFGMNFKWNITGLESFKLQGQSMGFSSSGNRSIKFDTYTTGLDLAAYGDQLGLRQSAMSGPLLSIPLDVSKTGPMAFGGGRIEVTISDAQGAVVQTIPIDFPDGSFPVPGIVAPASDYLPQVVAGDSLYLYKKYTPAMESITSATNMRYFNSTGGYDPNSWPTGYKPKPVRGGRLSAPDFKTAADIWFIDKGEPIKKTGSVSLENPTVVDVVRSVAATPGDIRLIAAKTTTATAGSTSYAFEKVNPDYWNKNVGVAGMHTFVSGNQENYYGSAMGRLAKVDLAGYTQLSNAPSAGSTGMYPGVFVNSRFPTRAVSATDPTLVLDYRQFEKNLPNTYGNSMADEFSPAASIPVDGAALGKATSFQPGDVPGDWDNVPSSLRDGPFINKPDEGDAGTSGTQIPYSWMIRTGQGVLNSSLFTPNRQICSAAMFGSLPTGVWANRPWQTLLFRYDPTGKHPGNKDFNGAGGAAPGMPADHLLLDLFHMPVVEPYAISEPLSTAGRINMNYQMVPFTYIQRSTGIHAIFKSERVIRIANNLPGWYKAHGGEIFGDLRSDVDTTETLTGFKAKFSSGDIFHSATEICELPIIPVGTSYALSKSFWDSYMATGDNSKERIYATVYPRLTTKSNTFTVHVRSQSLRQAKGNAQTMKVWQEGRDQVTGEYRGSQTIERFIDPNDSGLPDYADTSNVSAAPLGSFYRFRVLNTKQFAP